MKKREQKPKRRKHIRVPVLEEEDEIITRQAKQAGMSTARYLREVGQGYELKSTAHCEQVRELAQINGDLGRLGGLLKLWLTDDKKTAHFNTRTLYALLARIESNQEQMGEIMMRMMMPRAAPLVMKQYEDEHTR
jgi:hypothetical protein